MQSHGAALRLLCSAKGHNAPGWPIATRQISIAATRSSSILGSLAQGDALAAVGSPTQRADGHHGIVMDWCPQRFGEKLLEKPV
jgi:hypothetical protein